MSDEVLAVISLCLSSFSIGVSLTTLVWSRHVARRAAS